MATGADRGWGRPADGPWWRFTPKNTKTGYLGLLSGVLLVVMAVLNFASGDNAAWRTILAVLLVVLGLAQIIRSVDGLMVLRHGQSGR